MDPVAPAGEPPSANASRPPRIVAATLAVLAGSAVALLASLAIRVALARLLEPAAVGVLLLALGVVSAVGGVASLGVNQAIARHVASLLAAGRRAQAVDAARRVVAMAAAAGGLAVAALLLAAPRLGRWLAPAADAATLTAALRALSPVALALAIGLAGLGINRGYGGVRARVLVRDAGSGVLRLAAVTAAAALSHDLVIVCFAFAAALFAAEGSFLTHALRRLRRGARGAEVEAPGAAGPAADRAETARPLTLGRLVPFALLELLNQAQQWFDLLLLGLFVAPAEVALYGLARALTRAMGLVRVAAGHRFLPAVTHAAALPGGAGRQRLAGVYLGTRLLVLILLWLPMLAALALPATLMQLLFGADYRAGGSFLALLALAVLLETLFGLKDQTLVALGHEGRVVGLRLASQAVGVVTLLVLAPRFGAAGAAMAVLAMQVVRSTGLTVLLAATRELPPLRRELEPSLWAALALAGAAWLAARGLALGPAIAVLAAGGGTGLLLLVRAALRVQGADSGTPPGWRRLLGA